MEDNLLKRLLKSRYLGFGIYMALALIFIGPIFITPFLAQTSPQLFNLLQGIYAPTCHQLATRSLCYFQDGSIRDCAEPGGNVTGRVSVVEDAHSIAGYKFPVCARDVAIYGAMLLGGLIFPFVRRVDDRKAPALIYFFILLIPIALDGGTQLIGLRESTNELRLITGFLAGIAIPFYLIPIINLFVLGKEEKEMDPAIKIKSS